MRRIPDTTMRELTALFQRVRDSQEDFKSAVGAQAEKHGIEAAVLRRVVAAVARDRVDQARETAQGVLDLIEEQVPDRCPIRVRKTSEGVFEATSLEIG